MGQPNVLFSLIQVLLRNDAIKFFVFTYSKQCLGHSPTYLCIRVPKQVLVQKLSFSISSNSQACIVEHHGPFSQFNN